MAPSNRFAALLAFTIYTIVWELTVWAGGMYVILGWDWSLWWIALLVFMSGVQFRPSAFLEFAGNPTS